MKGPRGTFDKCEAVSSGLRKREFLTPLTFRGAAGMRRALHSWLAGCSPESSPKSERSWSSQRDARALEALTGANPSSHHHGQMTRGHAPLHQLLLLHKIHEEMGRSCRIRCMGKRQWSPTKTSRAWHELSRSRAGVTSRHPKFGRNFPQNKGRNRQPARASTGMAMFPPLPILTLQVLSGGG